jgi:nitrate reductase assembly molybdenum cofactor insertion protein NarJ
MKDLKYYKILADMLRYPEVNQPGAAQKFLKLVAASFPEKGESLKQLVESHLRLPIAAQQEYYLKTFDVQAICYLDIGYMMFGEDYKRAQLLVNLQSEHNAAGVDCGSELGDHLPNVLMLLSKTTDPDFAEELGFIITTPAVRFMITKFKGINNYYKDILETLLAFLQRDFTGEHLAEYVMPEQAFDGKNEFLMPSPKTEICDTHCKKQKSYKS